MGLIPRGRGRIGGRRVFTFLAIPVIACAANTLLAAVTFTTQHGANVDDFDGLISSTDLIQGKFTDGVDMFVNPADSFGHPSNVGWHPANTNPADQLEAFTDGAGMLASGLTGLLNDFPPESGSPAKIVQYALGGPVDIGRINILTGNRNNADGRIFSTTYIEYSTDGGINFQPLGYFQSDPSGSANTTNRSTFVSIFDDSSSTLLSGVTDIIFNLYSVSNTASRMQDPYDGVNEITGIDDTFDKAIESPLVLEIDVLPPAPLLIGDYNGNQIVDAADYVVWRENEGGDSLLNRDPSFSGPIDIDDYNAWKAAFGKTSGSGSVTANPATVPEPTAVYFLIQVALLIRSTRLRDCRKGTVTRTSQFVSSSGAIHAD